MLKNYLLKKSNSTFFVETKNIFEQNKLEVKYILKQNLILWKQKTVPCTRGQKYNFSP